MTNEWGPSTGITQVIKFYTKDQDGTCLEAEAWFAQPDFDRKSLSDAIFLLDGERLEDTWEELKKLGAERLVVTFGDGWAEWKL